MSGGMANLAKGYVVPRIEAQGLNRNTGWRYVRLAMFSWVPLETSPPVYARLCSAPEKTLEAGFGLEIFAGTFDASGKPVKQTWENTYELAVREEAGYHVFFDLHLRTTKDDEGYYLLVRPATQPYVG